LALLSLLMVRLDIGLLSSPSLLLLLVLPLMITTKCSKISLILLQKKWTLSTRWLKLSMFTIFFLPLSSFKSNYSSSQSSANPIEITTNDKSVITDEIYKNYSILCILTLLIVSLLRWSCYSLQLSLK